ncbi:conserved hypothetical protein [Tenacibaculum sediminilitoris]|uniref:hypothetical protein n=1 Tax=Tenacibaculum sediminilitoris TaxID=1820334 RepID=UPI0038940274
MKCLPIELLKKYELTSKEKSKIFAGDPIVLPEDLDSGGGFGDPDTDGEEDCFNLPAGSEIWDKCEDNKIKI